MSGGQIRLDQLGRFLTVFCIAALVVLADPGVCARAQEVDLEALDSWIGDLMEEWPTPGLAVGIVHGDSLVFARGYGVRDISGVSKSLWTSTPASRLPPTRRLSPPPFSEFWWRRMLWTWDDRVIDHLPEFQMWDPWVTREIRVRDLLTHRSGLATFGGDHLWIGATNDRDEIISRVRFMEPVGPFRASFHYQNLMFLVAGQVRAGRVRDTRGTR